MEHVNGASINRLACCAVEGSLSRALGASSSEQSFYWPMASRYKVVDLHQEELMGLDGGAMAVLVGPVDE